MLQPIAAVLLGWATRRDPGPARAISSLLPLDSPTRAALRANLGWAALDVAAPVQHMWDAPVGSTAWHAPLLALETTCAMMLQFLYVVPLPAQPAAQPVTLLVAVHQLMDKMPRAEMVDEDAALVVVVPLAATLPAACVQCVRRSDSRAAENLPVWSPPQTLALAQPVYVAWTTASAYADAAPTAHLLYTTWTSG